MVLIESMNRTERTYLIVRVLWSAFLLAAIGEFVFFAVFDPTQLHPFGVPLEVSGQWIYTGMFFFFWGLTAAAAALTMFLQRSRAQVNGSTAFSQPQSASHREREVKAPLPPGEGLG